MGIAAAVNSRGQLTLPVAVRRRLGLMKGGHVSIEERDGALLLRPAAVVAIEVYSDEQVAELKVADTYRPGERAALHRRLGWTKR